MAYGIDSKPFLELQNEVRKLPDEPPANPRELETLLFAFRNALATLLSLVEKILRACAERSARSESRIPVGEFLPIFGNARKRVDSLLDRELREGIAEESAHLIEFAYAIRESLIADEMVVLDRVIEKSAETAEPKEHGKMAHTVTDSVKELIKKYLKIKFIGPVLHALNEILSLVLR